MSKFFKNGNTFKVAPDSALDIHDKLPCGNYIIKVNPMSGELYLEIIDNFTPIKKYYGDLNKNADRIINTFLDRPNSTGVMLTGEKGSGKSLLAKELSIRLAHQHKVPTIVINQPMNGDVFNTFLQSIEQPTIILFDEFEKVFNKEEQESILTLLDGVFPSKKLFVLTCNDKWRVDAHMRNRPGRIYYMIDFVGLTIEFITEYCNDNLNDKTHIPKLCEIAGLFDSWNFDMLVALVAEMNRYNESPQEAMQLLNTKPEFGGKSTFAVSMAIDNKAVDLHPEYKIWVGNPLSDQVGVYYNMNPSATPTEDDDDSVSNNWEQRYFTYHQLESMDANSGTFHYVDADGRHLTLTRIKATSFNMMTF